MNRKDANNKKISKRDKIVKPQGKSIFSMFGKGKKSQNSDDTQSISDIEQRDFGYSNSYGSSDFDNDDMLSFIKDYDSKKGKQNSVEQPQSDTSQPVAPQMSNGATHQVYNPITGMPADDSNIADSFGSGASLSGTGTDSVFGNLGDSGFSSYTDIHPEEGQFSSSDLTQMNNTADFSQSSEPMNNDLSNFAMDEQPATPSADLNHDSLDTANDDIYAMLNTSSHVDNTSDLMSSDVDFQGADVQSDLSSVDVQNDDFSVEDSSLDIPQFDDDNSVSDESMPITDKIEEFYSNSVADSQEFDNYGNMNDDVNMDSTIDLDKYLEEFDKNDEVEEEQSSSRETDEERLKRIREKRKRRKERKKEKIRKYIEEGKKIEEKANSSLVVSNNSTNDDVFGDIEHFYSEKNENNSLKNENLDIQPRTDLSADQSDVRDSNIVNLEKMMKEQEMKLERLQRELEEKSNSNDSKDSSQNDELIESVTKKQIQLLKKELELNSRENELKNKVLNVSTKDIAQYKFDSVKYNKSYDVETALKHYETNPKQAIEELRDMAIYSRNNKEYMVAYLALKKLINDNSEFLEVIKEIETAKTKQKLEIERFISTLNVEKNKLL